VKPARGQLLDRPTWRGAFALWFLFVSAETLAQVSGSASLLSDYRYRGVSLSDNRPAAQLALAYDDASGWYGGALASTVQIGSPTSRELQAVAFGGYASRMPSGLSFEAGGDYSAFTGGQSYNYGEVYVGIASDKVSTRMYYARATSDVGRVYGEVNASEGSSPGFVSSRTAVSCATVATIPMAGQSIATYSMPALAWSSITISSAPS
jgi:uncharacterized protein (TIGR02001 family)